MKDTVRNPHNTPLLPPVTYQGGKYRIAKDIVDHIAPDPSLPFYDLCCGGGAVSLELVNRGYDPHLITMVDKGPWGLFWQRVGDGTFDIETFAQHCANIPTDRASVRDYMLSLAKQPPGDAAVYTFLLLQASTIGGTAVWIDGDTWRRGGGFRDYWKPTATSSRRSPVNPMMPMPETILERVSDISSRMHGVTGICADVLTIQPCLGSTVYVDPPYANTTGYGHTLDIQRFIKSVNMTCYVSEGTALSGESILLHGGRAKGGITGERAVTPHQEWLSRVA